MSVTCKYRSVYLFTLGWIGDCWSGEAISAPQDVVTRSVELSPSVWRVRDA